VAQLYGLIARSESAEAIHGDDYLGEIAANPTASLLGEGSGIAIAVDAEPPALHKDTSMLIGSVRRRASGDGFRIALRRRVRAAVGRHAVPVVERAGSSFDIRLPGSVPAA
jgi:hypothetical protein